MQAEVSSASHNVPSDALVEAWSGVSEHTDTSELY
jgi:hypothetical protein